MNAQELQLSREFELRGMLSPEPFTYSLPANDGFFSLVKEKGRPAGENEYVLRKYTKEATVQWETPYTLKANQYPLLLQRSASTIDLLVVGIDVETRQSSCSHHRFKANDGLLVHEDTLVQRSLGAWKPYFGKATVKQGFQNALTSIQAPNTVVPLEYQYYVRSSPDLQKHIVYNYDYSQHKLHIDVSVFNQNWEKVQSGTVPVDQGFISYGLEVNNRGQIYIYKSDPHGRMAVVQFDLSTKASTYLHLSTNNSQRDNLRIVQINDDVIYVAKINKKYGALVGVTYSKLDFEQKKIEKSVYHKFGQAFKDQIKAAQKTQKGIEVETQWKNYDIAGFFVSPEEEVYLFVEKRFIESDDYNYDTQAVEKLSGWTPRDGYVHTGTALLFAFVKDDRLKWESFILKEQKIHSVDGLTTTSMTLEAEKDDLYAVYATANKGLALNQINITSFDMPKGEKVHTSLL
jgi:hypothetical protein